MTRAPAPRQQTVVVGAAAVALVLMSVLPVVAVFFAAGPPWRAELPHADLQAIGWRDDVMPLLARSVATAGAVAAMSVAIGVPLGLYLTRFDVPARWGLLAVHAAPLCLPPFLPALGWYFALRRSGALESGSVAGALFGPVGLVGTLVLSLSPVVTLLVAFALQRIDPRMEETARVVARPQRVAWRIVVPLAWPAAALGALIVFVLAFSELAVPMFLRVRTYSAAVFVHLGGIEFAPADAATLCIPLGLLALVLLAVERRISDRWAVGGTVDVSPPLPLGRWRYPAAIVAGAVGLLGIAPLAALARRAGREGFAEAGAWMGSSLQTTLATSAIAATLILLLSIVLGHASARRFPGARVLDAIGVVGFVMPAALIGVGLAWCWNRPFTQALYASPAILVLGYGARYTAVGVRVVAGALGRDSGRDEEEAAASVGARYLRRLLLIVVPRHRTALASAWLLAFVFCLRDLDSGIVVHPPGGETLLTRIFTLEANGPEPVVAALATIQVAVTAAIVSLLAWVSTRRGTP